MYSLRKLKVSDLDRVDEIINKAKLNMRDVLKIDQWQAGYPNRDTYTKDISDATGYVLCDEKDTVVGGTALIFTGESEYDKITDNDGEFDGKWKHGENYATIHRICVDKDITCKGVGSTFLKLLFNLSKEKGFTSVRVDTHRFNKPMRALLKKNGFEETGVIYIYEPLHNERITYERKL